MPRISLEDIGLEDFLQAKRDSVITAALDKSRTRIGPENVSFKVNLSQEDIDKNKKTIKSFEDELKLLDYAQYGNQFINYYTQKYNKDEEKELSKKLKDSSIYPLNTDEQYNIRRKSLTETINEYKDILSKGWYNQRGLTCINTATNNYGPGHQVSGNITFYNNPSKYGFVEINKSDIKPGDLIQVKEEGINPHHAVIFNGYDKNGRPSFNYSDGGYDAENYKVGVHWDSLLRDGNDNRIYRFVGNQKDIEDWTKEYNSRKMRNGGIVSVNRKSLKTI